MRQGSGWIWVEFGINAQYLVGGEWHELVVLIKQRYGLDGAYLQSFVSSYLMPSFGKCYAWYGENIMFFFYF